MPWELIWALFVLIVVLVLAYYVTLFIGKHGGGFSKSQYMQVIDRVAIDRNTTLVIVKIVDHYQVIVVGSHAIENLGVVNDLEEVVHEKVDFKNIMNTLMKKKEEDINE